jgi:hypothetical protein
MFVPAVIGEWVRSCILIFNTLPHTFQMMLL